MRWRQLARFAAVLIAALFAYALPEMVADEPDPLECFEPGTSRTALLAVGDTGQPAGRTGMFDSQLSLAAALDFEHRERPVDALVLLGDNFPPRGLAREDLVSRIRQNLVRPYCRFLDLTGSRAALVTGACGISPELRRPVRLLAVLGDHDVKRPEGAELQRREVASYVSNWRMSRDLADVSELPGGVSVIHFDSVGLRAGEDPAPLVDALRASRGPWRVLAGHHPLLESTAELAESEDAYRDALLGALERAGRRVHLLLSGHGHELQIGVTQIASLPLQVIAGGGADAAPPRSEIQGREFSRSFPGYARVDLVGSGETEELILSLASVARYPFQFWRAPRVESCWRVTREGAVAASGRRLPVVP